MTWINHYIRLRILQAPDPQLYKDSTTTKCRNVSPSSCTLRSVECSGPKPKFITVVLVHQTIILRDLGIVGCLLPSVQRETANIERHVPFEILGCFRDRSRPPLRCIGSCARACQNPRSSTQRDTRISSIPDPWSRK